MSSLSHHPLPHPRGLGKQQQRYRWEKSSSSSQRRATSAISSSPSSFIPTELSEFIEPAAIEMARRVQVVEVPVEGREKNVMTSLVQSEKREDASEYHPFVLLHGFDSSCLEYRRLFPKLEENGAEVYALDLLGWGFTDGLDGGVGDYSPEAKCAHLYAWWKQNVNRPIVLAGASLGGAAAIEFASRYPEAVIRLVLIDAQGFIDGIGPMGMLPTPIAKAGVDILRTRWLRSGANKMAYLDQKYATDDAQNVGRLHTLLPQWNDATLSFMRSGGFRVVEKIPQLTTKTMVLWGRGDRILEPENAERFEKEIEDCELVWVEESGHVPHLEQPDFTCAQLLRFGKK
ncbi:unnamed protein product [Bathycoccus prasinos]